MNDQEKTKTLKQLERRIERAKAGRKKALELVETFRKEEEELKEQWVKLRNEEVK